MNKQILLIITLAMAGASCKKGILTPPSAPQETRVNKVLEFRIAQAAEYSSPAYDGIKAELRLTVSKENMRNGTNTVLSDTIFSMRALRQYPEAITPLVVTKQYNGILESEESIRVSREIQYIHSNNNTWMNAKGESISTSTPLTRLEVNL